MGKKHLLDVLRHKKVDRPAWVPFAGVHAGRLAGFSPEEVLIDPDKLTKALKEVHRLYQPDGMPIAFDLQVEAEILGCQLRYAEDGPPQVVSHPLQGERHIPCECMMPEEKSGRLGVFIETTRRLQDEIGDDVALYGLVTGPFTLASHLRGTEIFIDMYDDMDYVRGLIDYCMRFVRRVAGFYAEAGCDVIAYVDPLVSQISNDHFREMLSGPYRSLFDDLREKGVLSSFFVCGDATKNLEAMCETGPDSLSIDENIEMPSAKRITDKHNIALGGNIPLTSVMLHGSQQDNMKFVVDMVESLDVRDKNLVVSPGCDMPFDTPPENTIAVSQAVREFQPTKRSLANYQQADQETLDVDLPDYENLDRPLIEVFTIDSATCAACTYMMGVAHEAKKYYGDRVDIAEHKATKKETIVRCRKLGVKNMPAIYINGELCFSSLIPSMEELREAIDKVL